MMRIWVSGWPIAAGSGDEARPSADSRRDGSISAEVRAVGRALGREVEGFEPGCARPQRPRRGRRGRLRRRRRRSLPPSPARLSRPLGITNEPPIGAHEHGQQVDQQILRPEGDQRDRRPRADARHAPADAEQRRADRPAAASIRLNSGWWNCTSNSGLAEALADADAPTNITISRRPMTKARLGSQPPVANGGEVEEAQHLQRIDHLRDVEADAEQEARRRRRWRGRGGRGPGSSDDPRRR